MISQIFIYFIFLVKNCTREFFLEIETFSSKTFSFDIFFSDKKKLKKKFKKRLKQIREITTFTFRLSSFDNFFQCHESIGDIA